MSDSVDVHFEKDGRRLVVIDTAGVRRKRSLQGSVDFYGQVRTESAIRRCDVALLLLDSTQEITRVDKKIAETIVAESKACVIVANKWDLMKGIPTESFARYVHDRLRGLRFAPIVFTTATAARNVLSAVDLAQSLAKQAAYRAGTGELNRVVEAIREGHMPRILAGKIPKIFYATQVAVRPPTVVFVVNEPRAFPPAYRRYMENALRERLPFREVPIRLLYRKRESIYHA